jgi:RNA polymerase sigma-70 factor, ECF subfamily
VGDAELATAAASGDEGAFSALVERYRRFIFAIAYRIVLDEDDAFDIAQNVLLRLADRIGQFKGQGTFRAWLAAIAANEAISHARSAGRRREDAMDPADIEALSDSRVANGGGMSVGDDARESLDRERRMERVEAAMADLAPQQRAIFALRFHEDMEPAEIAQRLGIPGKQVRSQLCRAVARLRKKLGKE